MYFIYSILYTTAVIILLIPQCFKRPSGLRLTWLREKLGFPAMTGREDKGSARSFWVHAVSVGEVMAAVPFLHLLRSSYPGSPVILSTMTDTGRAVAEAKAPVGVRVVYMPFDSFCITKHFLRRINPLLFIIVETEIWPNAIRAAHVQGIPVIMVNGRISENSFRRYKKISGFMKRVLSRGTLYLMQTGDDAERMRLMGAEEKKIIVSGSFKFDCPERPAIPPWATRLKGPVIVAGSTHTGEEELMIAALRKNLDLVPALKLVLAPRHPERFNEVEALVKASGLSFVRRTQFDKAGGEERADSHIIILDSIGELASVYGIADIAVIGKSFSGQGGQNPLEAALWGKAILCGPHMENFPFISVFYKEGAAFEVSSEGLAEKIRELLEAPSMIREAGEKASMLYVKNSGAVVSSFEAVKQCIH